MNDIQFTFWLAMTLILVLICYKLRVEEPENL